MHFTLDQLTHHVASQPFQQVTHAFYILHLTSSRTMWPRSLSNRSPMACILDVSALLLLPLLLLLLPGVLSDLLPCLSALA